MDAMVGERRDVSCAPKSLRDCCCPPSADARAGDPRPCTQQFQNSLGATAGGVTIKLYGPAKTVADCFKFRHLVGHDVVLEALRDCLRERRATIDEIWAAARIDRVANLIRPYLEALA